MSRHIRDAVIVGGGVVGATLALGLARQGQRVALIESREVSQWRADAPPDLRVYAISPASSDLLDSLQLWPQVLASRAQAYGDMRVWDAGGRGELHFGDAAPLGHIVEHALLQHVLWQALRAQAEVECLVPARFRGFEQDADGVRVELEDDHSIRARLLIAADGGSSAVRSAAGIDFKLREYGQRGLVAYVRPQQPHAETAWQRFLPTGPLALLPFTEGRCSIVWSLPADEAQRLQSIETPAFEAELARASDQRLGALELCSERASFPLRMGLAECYVRDRLLLIGDAAHAVHPLAGQGMNLGLQDVAELLDALSAAPQRAGGPPLTRALRRYDRRRRSANTVAAYSFDGLNRLFSSYSPLPTLLRGPALGLVDRLAPLKRVLQSHATGRL